MTKLYRNLRTSDQAAKIEELNVLLKMFNSQYIVLYDKGDPKNGRKCWRAYPFRIREKTKSIICSTSMFATFEELWNHVHKTLIPFAQSIPAQFELESEPECSTCEGGGWMFSIYQAAHAPNFVEC